MRPLLSRKSIHARSADANTSAGAPESICLASADEAPNETLGSGWPAFCHFTEMSVNAFVKLAAAKTRTCSSAWALAAIANKMIDATPATIFNIGVCSWVLENVIQSEYSVVHSDFRGQFHSGLLGRFSMS